MARLRYTHTKYDNNSLNQQVITTKNKQSNKWHVLPAAKACERTGEHTPSLSITSAQCAKPAHSQARRGTATNLRVGLGGLGSRGGGLWEASISLQMFFDDMVIHSNIESEA